MRLSLVVWQVPEVVSLLRNADYSDETVATGAVSMREFVAYMLNYQPAWFACLYSVRGVCVRLLGIHQEGRWRSPRLQRASLDDLRYALRAGKKGAENGQRIDGFYLGFYQR